MNLLDRARQAIATATQARVETLAKMDPAIDDADEIATVEAYDPQKALVPHTVAELRALATAGAPSDPAAAEIYRVKMRSIRDLPPNTEVASQACDLLTIAARPSLPAPASTKQKTE